MGIKLSIPTGNIKIQGFLVKAVQGNEISRTEVEEFGQISRVIRCQNGVILTNLI